MAAQVGDDHAVPAGERLENGLEHLAADHQAMDEQKGRSRSALDEVQEIGRCPRRVHCVSPRPLSCEASRPRSGGGILRGEEMSG
jgi:hypothetical protein